MRPALPPRRRSSWWTLAGGAMAAALLGACVCACNRDPPYYNCPTDVIIGVEFPPLDTTSPPPDAGPPSYTIELDGLACGSLGDDGHTLHLSGAEGTCTVTVVFEGGGTKSQEFVVGHFLRGCDRPIPEMDQIIFPWP